MRRVAMLLLVFFLSTPAFAGRVVVLEDECRGKQLLFMGPIEAGDGDRFAQALATLILSPDLPPVQDNELLWTVKFDSPGGDVDEAMAIGRLLRRGLAATEVSYRFKERSDGVYDFERSEATLCPGGSGRLAGCFPDIVKAECAGACLLAWLGGAHRFAHEGRIGVHDLDLTPAVRDYLREMQVADNLVDRLAPSQSSGPQWLEWRERSALAGIAPALAEPLAACPPALDQQESLDSVMHADLRVRETLMNRAYRHRQCRLAILARAQKSLRPEFEARRGVPGERLTAGGG
ncbi:MAG: hypothetical protein ACO3Z6_05690 [Pseudomonadales bacterium]